MKSQVEKIKQKEEFFKQIVHEMKTEERFVDYFKQFDPQIVEVFIKSYAQQKVAWYELAEHLNNWKNSKQDVWMEACFEALCQIQHKKLFNAQCLWRAEKTKLEAIEICMDFLYWEHNILWCPAIKPVEQHEIDFYIQFLKETPLDKKFDEVYQLQEYDEIKQAFLNEIEEEYSSYIPWYEYYDREFGTYELLKLPDIRGEKEHVYIHLSFGEEQRIRDEEDSKKEKIQDNRKHLNYHENNFEDNFIKENESKEFYRQHQAKKSWMHKKDENEEPLMCISELKDIPQKYLPLVSADKWQTAVIYTWEKHRRDMLIEFMPQAYQLYLKHAPKKWDYPGFTEFDPGVDLPKRYREMIIKGRQMNNEAPDLNF